MANPITIAWENHPPLHIERLSQTMTGKQLMEFVLPQLDPAPTGGQYLDEMPMAQTSATNNQRPPEKMLRIDRAVLTHMLTQPQVDRALSFLFYVNVPIERYHYLQSAADVVRAVQAYIVNPVNQVLGNVLRDSRIRCHSEVVFNKDTGRIDVVWEVHDGSGIDGGPAAVLVLELKKRSAQRPRADILLTLS
jgi:hypothetical protein